MKDFLGRILVVGDKVVHGVGGRYGGLDGPYYIDSFTPKMVRISRPKSVVHDKTVPPGNLVLIK
jgi:hypothetical protein